MLHISYVIVFSIRKLRIPEQSLIEHCENNTLRITGAMPSAASAQRQGQIVAKQFKSFAKASAEYKKHPEKFLGKPKLPGYRNKNIVHFAWEETAIRLRTIA